MIPRGESHRGHEGDTVELGVADAAALDDLRGAEVLGQPARELQSDHGTDVVSVAVAHHLRRSGCGVPEVAAVQELVLDDVDLLCGQAGSGLDHQDVLVARLGVEAGTRDAVQCVGVQRDLLVLHRRQGGLGVEVQVQRGAVLLQRPRAAQEALSPQALGRVEQHGFGHDAPFVSVPLQGTLAKSNHNANWHYRQAYSIAKQKRFDTCHTHKSY